LSSTTTLAGAEAPNLVNPSLQSYNNYKDKEENINLSLFTCNTSFPLTCSTTFLTFASSAVCPAAVITALIEASSIDG